MSIFAEFQAYKEKVGCFDCYVIYPHYILEFDHRPEHKKIDIVYRVLKKFGVDAAWEEVRKCDVVCSNCHKQRTYEREQNDSR
tara:strand:+ start:13457 stop:13705 length:249 start_codon:yes stop_codon:yes gene_type:complete